MARNFASVLSIRPAPTSRTSAAATSSTTSASRVAARRLASGNLAPDPPPGVYALHDSADRPALLPDGTTSELSVSSALSPRDPGDEPRFVPPDKTLEITAESGEWEPAPSGRADS